MAKLVRPIRVEGDVAYVTLTKGYEAIIDADDVPMASQFNWQALVFAHTVYAQRCTARDIDGKQTSILLHRAIMDAQKGVEVDHICGNGLDNRRANLRFATRSENMCNARMRLKNKSGYKGVFWHKGNRAWRAKIVLNGIAKELGSFNTPEAAYTAYVKASAEYHGEFGRVR